MNDRNAIEADQLRGLSDELKATMVATYREIAAGSRQYGQLDIVEHCERQIAALSYGGSLVVWTEAAP